MSVNVTTKRCVIRIGVRNYVDSVSLLFNKVLVNTNAFDVMVSSDTLFDSRYKAVEALRNIKSLPTEYDMRHQYINDVKQVVNAIDNAVNSLVSGECGTTSFGDSGGFLINLHIEDEHEEVTHIFF